MSGLQFTSVDRIFSKIHRDLRGIDVNESDVIEWIGEVLDDLKLPQSQEQSIAFIEVKNYQADLPKGFQMILQVARNNQWRPETKEKCSPINIIKELKEEDKPCYDCDEYVANKQGYPVPLNCHGEFMTDVEVAYYRPFFDVKKEYRLWRNNNYYKQHYTPVRLANNTFFNSLVCKEKDSPYQPGCKYDEYTIVGTVDKKLRFSFKEGQIALAYLKTAIDEETGYPLVPDNKSAVRAITYYIKFKVSEWYNWNGREGYQQEEQKAFSKYEKYVRQFNNYIKMPKSIDDFQDLLEQSHYLVPRHRRYYGFFGNLGKEENKKFNNPW